MKTQFDTSLRCLFRIAALGAAGNLATASDRLPLGGDFDGDGKADAAYCDAASSSLAVGYGIADLTLEWRTFDLRRYSYGKQNGFRVADLNNDGRDDLYTANREANRVLVLWGLNDRAEMFGIQEFIVGAGPAFAAAIPLAGNVGLAVPLVASANPSLHRFRPASPGDPPQVDPIDPALAGPAWLDFQAGHSASGVINPPLFMTGLVGPDGALPRLHVFQKYPLGALVSADIAVLAGLNRLTELGFFAGPASAPATVAFGAGESRIAVCTLTPGALGNPPSVAMVPHAVGAVADVRRIVTPMGDRLLVVPQGGGRANLYDLGGGGFAIAQSIDPPAGRDFLALVPGPGGLLLAAFTDGGEFAVYRDAGSGFQLQQSGALPAPPPPGSGRQFVLYDNHPFGAAPSFQLEGFPGADWADEPGLAGVTIHVDLNRFVDAPTGLAGLGQTSVDASVAVPPTAVVLANQIDADTSTSFSGGPGADGGAAVLAFPPGGTYAHTVNVGFVTSPGVTVHYRLDTGPWSVASSDVPIARPGLTTLEFLGESAGGELSSIRTEQYRISQDPNADTDGDKVPDAIEIAAGLSPFAGSDTDGDGINDFSELVAGSDPSDPSDAPAENLALDVQTVEVTLRCPSAAGGLVAPGVNTEMRVAGLDGAPVAIGATTSIAAPHATFQIEVGERRPLFVIESAPVHHLGGILSLWPQGRRLAAVVELPGKAIPTGPVDLASNDLIGDWLAGVNAAIAANQAQIVEVTLDTDSTLSALAFEAWLGARLTVLGRIVPEEKLPHIVDQPLPGVRHLVSAEDLEAIEADDGTQLRHRLTEVWQSLRDAVAAGAATPLRKTMANFYQTSAAAAPGETAPPPPLPSMREILADGDVPAAYAGSLAAPLPTLALLWAQILGSPQPATVVMASGALETVGDGCLVLVDGTDGTRYELVDAGHEAFWQTENAPILTGALAVLQGFATALPPTCGDIVVEVSSLLVVDVPVAIIPDAGANGLPDEFELILLGGTSGFWEDDDGDGYANGEELLLDPDNPTDPADPGSFPSVPPALPTGAEATGEAGANFTLEWDGNPTVPYVVETSGTLGSDWVPSPVLPVQMPPGHFQWQDPDPIVGNDRRFYRIVAQLVPPLP